MATTRDKRGGSEEYLRTQSTVAHNSNRDILALGAETCRAVHHVGIVAQITSHYCRPKSGLSRRRRSQLREPLRCSALMYHDGVASRGQTTDHMMSTRANAPICNALKASLSEKMFGYRSRLHATHDMASFGVHYPRPKGQRKGALAKCAQHNIQAK